MLKVWFERPTELLLTHHWNNFLTNWDYIDFANYLQLWGYSCKSNYFPQSTFWLHSALYMFVFCLFFYLPKLLSVVLWFIQVRLILRKLLYTVYYTNISNLRVTFCAFNPGEAGKAPGSPQCGTYLYILCHAGLFKWQQMVYGITFHSTWSIVPYRMQRYGLGQLRKEGKRSQHHPVLPLRKQLSCGSLIHQSWQICDLQEMTV